ncbi:MAG: Gfo/Idh/MocA family oxidoreductase [Saprospiraceae bacterium]|nr:Gfo/Idh/MocA family oxidoreductase [Saprospiraceae bacterium]
MESITRGKFIKTSTVAGLGLMVLPRTPKRTPNDRVVIGIMGLGGRGNFLAGSFAGHPEVEITYLCDVDSRKFARTRETVESAQKNKPQLIQDFREMLADPDVDAIINATPDHWHGLGTIMACQAGKDVFCEKPLSHNVWEGRQMVAAVRKYERVVQVGMQSRSAAYVRKAKEYIDSGKLGDIHYVRVLNMMKHGPFTKGPEQEVPDGFDYEIWCGPAPKYPYAPGHWWHGLWDFSVGRIPDDLIHQLDLARLLMGKDQPDTIYSSGGVNVLKDGREIPDTQMSTFEFGSQILSIESSLWMPYMKKTVPSIRDSDQYPNWPFNSTKIEFYGSEGFMHLGRHGGGWQAFDADGEMVASSYGRQADLEHQQNFIDCIRSRQKPVADVEEGHHSVNLCHLANISYRVGSEKLVWDKANERFKNHETANKLLKRAGRKPWMIPELV